jgi:hypothetical protein
LYSRPALQAQPAQQAQAQAPQPQIPQQVYQKQQNELQFLNSQQLFRQQLEMQQQQLHRDRTDARKATPVQSIQAHRFQLPQNDLSQFRAQAAPAQQYYYVQPGQATGQIDGFLRAHNIDY